MEKEHKTEPHYRELYLRWQSSGLTVGTFCQQESIKYATFRYWAKKFEQPDNGVPGFTELKLSRQSIITSPGPIAVIRIGRKATLALYEMPDQARLSTLML